MVKVLHFNNYSHESQSNNPEGAITLDNIIARTNKNIISYYQDTFPINKQNTLKGEFQESLLICGENVEEFEECLRYGDKRGMVLLYIEEIEVKELMYQLSNEMTSGLYDDELLKIRNLKDKFNNLLESIE